MPIELKTETPRDMPEHKPALEPAKPAVELPPYQIVPPPIPGQTAWSIVPW